MTEIKYVTGDATRPVGEGAKIIAHICNDKGKWGSGFVVALSKWDGTPEREYRSWYNQGYAAQFGLGQTRIAPFGPVGDDTWVANMVAQEGVRHDMSAPPAVRYDALASCLEGLARILAVRGDRCTIHMPRIGCGLGGGSWDRVEPLIITHLTNRGIPVTVYDLP